MDREGQGPQARSLTPVNQRTREKAGTTPVSDSPFKKATAGGGDFFKPAEHIHDLAIVIEAKKILRDQPHEYEGIKSTRDVAVADMAFFRNQADVDSKTPSVILKGAQITNQILVADVERNEWLGEAAVTVVRKPKRPYVWRNEVAADAEAAAAAWFENRDKARAAAADDMPEI